MGTHIRFEDSNLSPFQLQPQTPLSHLQRLLIKDGLTNLSRRTLGLLSVFVATLLVTIGVHMGLNSAFPNATLNVYAAMSFCFGSIYLALIADSNNLKEGVILFSASVLTIAMSLLSINAESWGAATALYAHAGIGMALYFAVCIDLVKDYRILTGWITFNLISAILI